MFPCMFPFKPRPVLADRFRPVSRGSAFGHLSIPKKEPSKKPPAPAKKVIRPPEPAPAASVPYNFSHLQRAAMKRTSLDGLTSRLEDTKSTTNDLPRRSSADARAYDFAVEMEQVQATVEGRKPRQLVDDGPRQSSQAFDAAEMIAVLQRRDASRAAPRSDRIG